MPAKSSVVSLSACFVFLIHFLILFSINKIMPQEISFFGSLQGILLLVISWVPLFLMVCVFLFYCILINPPRYIEVRKYLYTNGFMMFISLSILFNIKQILLYVNMNIVSTTLVLVIVISTIVSIIINRLIYKNGFNFNREISDLSSVRKELQKLSFSAHLDKINLSMYLFIIPFSIQPKYFIFILMTLAIATFAFIRLLRIKDAFQECYNLHRTNTNSIVVNYCISIVLAIVIYTHSQFLSIVLIFSSYFMVYIITSRIARYYYKSYEGIL